MIEHERDPVPVVPSGDLAAQTSRETEDDGKSFYEKIWERDHPDEVKKENDEQAKRAILDRADKLEKQAKLMS